MSTPPLILPIPGFSTPASGTRYVIIDSATNTACAETFLHIANVDSDGAGGFSKGAVGRRLMWFGPFSPCGRRLG